MILNKKSVIIYECNNIIRDLLYLLPFSKKKGKKIAPRLINQRHVVFYLGKVRYLAFYTGMILSWHLK